MYAILKFRGVKKEKMLTMGCPQGSILGPTLWVVLFDSFLRMPLPEGCETFSYADDGLLLVSADSRAALEQKTETACRWVLEWSRNNRLNLSVDKTKTVQLKGRLIRKPQSRWAIDS